MKELALNGHVSSSNPGQPLNSFDLIDHGARAGEGNFVAGLWEDDQV